VRRGILGGTFDPPHLAHLIAGEVAYRQLGLDVVTFMPAGAPWQKAGKGVSSAHHRMAMTELAVSGIDYFEADGREVDRDGWTYTIDTIEQFPESDDLYLVLGADAAAGLGTWHRSEDVVARATIAVMSRPGTDRSAVAGNVVWLDAPEVAISGTELRARRRRGLSIRFLVREPVYAYIEEHDVYAP
jgi:nicotinate-nucleotide adenylyltransferase